MKKELVLEIIQERWSPCAFSRIDIEDFKLKAMLEAAGHAPSCFNEQPWMFIFATCNEKDVFEDYLGFLSESNRVWAKSAYALIITFARTTFTHNGKPNRFALYDTGMAVTNLILQAMTFDIYVHQMAGYSVDKVKEYFKLGPDIEAISVMAVGYLGDGADLPPDIVKRDEHRRPKKPVNEYTFRNKNFNTAF